MTTAQTTRTPAFVQADWHSGRVVDRAGRTATAAEVLTALNTTLADRDRLRAALVEWLLLAESASKSPATNRAWCDYRDLCALIGNTSAALAQSEKGE